MGVCRGLLVLIHVVLVIAVLIHFELIHIVSTVLGMLIDEMVVVEEAMAVSYAD